jgi:hypothetical protein
MKDVLAQTTSPQEQDPTPLADGVTAGDTGHGVIILESLLPGPVPAPVASFIQRTYQHWLSGSRLTTIAILAIPAAHVLNTAEQIAKLLRPRGFYAHIVWRGRLLVIFPNSVFDVVQSDTPGIASLRSFGVAHGIPERQMRFEDLFMHDHPNQAQDQPTLVVNPTEFFSAANNSGQSGDVLVCGRVLSVTEDGLAAEVIANGRTRTVRFPTMPGPMIGDIVGCKGQRHHYNGMEVLHVSHWGTLTSPAPTRSALQPGIREPECRARR